MSELYNVTIEPVELPVTLEECKDFMKVTSTFEDDLISAFIETATDQIEQYTGRVFVERTIEASFDSLFCSKYEAYPFISLMRAPLQSVTSVQIDGDDESYQLKEKTKGYSRLILDEVSLSSFSTPYPLQIVFIAGYGGASDVPSLIKTAIKMYVNFLYKNRGDCGGVTSEVKSILAPYRILEVFA